jgi:DNA-binding GntR family transcriptional regulator
MPVPDKVARIPRRSARMHVFDRLCEWIEDGTLAPGEVVKDIEIAGRLDVSRTPVREALQRLEQLGLVETEPSRHTRIAQVDPRDAALLYPPLAALVVESVEQAALIATPADLEAMQAANEDLLQAVERATPNAATTANYAFHDVLVRRAGNPYLTSAIDLLHVHSRRLDMLYFTHFGPSHESYREHREILEAVEAGDLKRAKEITRRNFIRTIPVFARGGKGGGT